MSIWTEWDPLERVIVGDCSRVIPAHWDLSHAARQLLDQILTETKQDLDHLSALLTSLGVQVDRPQVHEISEHIKLPGFDILKATNPIVPRDQYLVYGNTIYQTYTSLPDRYVDSLHYYDIFMDLFQQGHNWISQPPPVLKNFEANYKWYVNGPNIYSDTFRQKILWHTATMFKCGDRLITNSTGPGTQAGLEWMRRNTADTIIDNAGTTCENWGHIDHGFYMIDDNTVICVDPDWVPASLRSKRLISLQGMFQSFNYRNFFRKTYKIRNNYSLEWLEQWMSEWRGYAQLTAMESNVLVVDSQNVVFSTVQPRVFELMQSLGVNCHVSPQRHGMFWEAGIHCVTLDLQRKGSRRCVVDTPS